MISFSRKIKHITDYNIKGINVPVATVVQDVLTRGPIVGSLASENDREQIRIILYKFYLALITLQ